MAGDWIKIETNILSKPEVMAISEELDIEVDEVFVALFKVWVWFDQHTENGDAPCVTEKSLDRIAHVSGFACAMRNAQWLRINEHGVSVPHFDYHNGKSAKKRALTAKRNQEFRKRNRDDECVTKRREEKNIKNNKKSAQNKVDAQEKFAQFWKAYPVKKDKSRAQKSFAKINPDDDLLLAMIQAIGEQQREREYLSAQGQFVPEWKYAATWLNGYCWEDAISVETKQSEVMEGVI